MSESCLSVRERLVDLVLAALPPEEAREVGRHLEWCAGCRKELAELREGAAVLGWSIERAEPPRELEDRVVDAVAEVAGARTRERQRLRVVSVAAVIAGVVAVAAVGWAALMAGRLQRIEAEEAAAAAQAARAAELAELGGRQVEVQLEPAPGGAGWGQALVTLSGGRGADWVVVIAGGLPEDAGPYEASVVHGTGVEVFVGRLLPASHGQLSAYRIFRQDLSGFRRIAVTDANGRVLLEGAISPAPGSS